MSADFDKILSDRLNELGNIGCNRALKTLSQLTSTEFVIREPDVEFLDYSKIPDRLGDTEETVVSLMVNIAGDIDGIFILLFRPKIAARLLEAIGVKAPKNFLKLSEMQLSALLELGNIMCSSYMTAVSELTGLAIKISIPACAVDMLGSVLSVPVIHFAEEDSELLYIKNIFTIEDRDWIGGTLLFSGVDSAGKLSDRLGTLV